MTNDIRGAGAFRIGLTVAWAVTLFVAACTHGETPAVDEPGASSESVDGAWKGVAGPMVRTVGAAIPKAGDSPSLHAVASMTGAVLAGMQGRIDEGLAQGRRAVDEARRGLAPEHPARVGLLTRYASLLMAANRVDEASPIIDEALELAGRVFGRDHPISVQALNLSAARHYQSGTPEQVEADFRKALAINEKAYGPDHPTNAVLLNNLALLLTSSMRYDEAEPLYRRSLAIDEKALGPDNPNLAATLNNLAILADSMGRPAEAETLYRRSIAILVKAKGADHAEVIRNQGNLATLLFTQGKAKDACDLLKTALAAADRTLPAVDSDRGLLLIGLGDCLAELADSAGARKAYERGLDQLGSTLGPEHPYTRLGHALLAELLDSVGELEQAAEHRKLAGDIAPSELEKLVGE